MIESTGSMGRTATYAEELLVAEVTRLRQELSLAEEGLANYAQEVAQLRQQLDHYGVHLEECARYGTLPDDNIRCTCGLADAIAVYHSHQLLDCDMSR